MPAIIGNTSFYENIALINTNIHNGTLTLGSAARRKIELHVLQESETGVITSVTINGATPTADVNNPFINPNDLLLRINRYYYDVPVNVAAGTVAISVTTSTSGAEYSWHCWEIIDAALGGPEAVGAGHQPSPLSATTSVVASQGAALCASAIMHAGAQTITVSGNVIERRENDEPNHTTVSADASNVVVGTKSVTITPSSGARNSVLLVSYAPASFLGRAGRMAFANVFTDNFNRGNGPLGSNYDTAAGFNSLNVNANTARGFSSGRSLNSVKKSVVTFSPNQEAQVTYTIFNPTYFDFAGPAVRVTPESGSGYVLNIDSLDASSRRLIRVSGSVNTGIVGAINLPAAAGDIFKLSASGSTLRVYRNGILVNSVTDATYPTGQPGLFYDLGNSNTTRMDNFIAADIPTTNATSLCIVSQTPVGNLIVGSQ